MSSSIKNSVRVGLTMMSIGATLLSQAQNITHKALPHRAIKTFRVMSTSRYFSRNFSGLVRPIHSSTLSFPVAGKIITLHDKLGRFYKKGKLLAQLDKKKLKLDQLVYRAEVNKAEAMLIESKAHYNAVTSLYKKSHISKLRFQKIRAEYKARVSQLELAKARYEIASSNLAHANLVSPYDGVVSKVFVRNHMVVRGGTPVMNFEGVNGYEVKIGIPDNLISLVQLNQKVKVHVVRNTVLLEGKVTEISNSSSSSYVYPVVIKILTPPPQLKPGMTCQVTLKFHDNKGASLVIPLNAIQSKANSKDMFVFLYNPKSQTVYRKSIKATAIRNDMAVIRSGLNAGDIIATSGVQFLHNEQRVSLFKGSK